MKTTKQADLNSNTDSSGDSPVTLPSQLDMTTETTDQENKFEKIMNLIF